MRERLREIAEQTFRDWIIFFGKPADIVTNIQKTFKDPHGVVTAALQNVVVCQPEGAGEKLSFSVRQISGWTTLLCGINELPHQYCTIFGSNHAVRHCSVQLMCNQDCITVLKVPRCQESAGHRAR